jgi:hypothetical protein
MKKDRSRYEDRKRSMRMTYCRAERAGEGGEGWGACERRRRSMRRR